jgi:hypothetical protein
MKVIFPGPAVTGETRTIPTYYGALGVGVVVGENDLEIEPAAVLLQAGHVVLHAADPEPEPQPVEVARMRGRSRTNANRFETAGTSGEEE